MHYSEFIAGLTFEDLPPEVVERTGLAVLDTVGAMLGGLALPSARIASDFALGLFTGPRALDIVSGRRIPLANAIFANATAASALDIDDCQKLCVGHPGAVIVPAALTTADALGCTGRELITAVAVGYEVGTRFGALQSPAWDSAVIFGAGRLLNSGAAAASASLLALEAIEARHAVGLAYTFGPTGRLLDEPAVQLTPMSKEAVGWGSMTGAMAAFLAGDGFTGPDWRLPPDQDHIGPVGQDWTILRSTYKPYPSCRFTHPCIDAALALIREHGPALAPDNIASIRVRVFNKAMHMNHPAPPGAESAQYSIPYTVAAALRDGDFWLEHLKADSLADPGLLELSARVELVHDPDCDRTVFDRRIVLEIETRQGEIFSRMEGAPRGDLDNPLTARDLENKFLRLAGEIMSDDKARELSSRLLNLEEETDLSRLLSDYRAA